MVLAISSMSCPCPLFDWVKTTCQSLFDRIQNIFRRIAECFFTPSVTPPQGNPRNVLAFYRKEEPNNRGVTLENILEADDEWLEGNHHWVQWAFPTEAPSGPNPTGPVLNPATIEAFRNDPIAAEHMVEVFNKMLDFYGLEKESDETITRGSEFSSRTKLWLYPNSHHFKRITRIIHSMALLLPTENYSKTFFEVMDSIAKKEGKKMVSDKSRNLWRKAI